MISGSLRRMFAGESVTMLPAPRPVQKVCFAIESDISTGAHVKTTIPLTLLDLRVLKRSTVLIFDMLTLGIRAASYDASVLPTMEIFSRVTAHAALRL